MDAQLAHLDDLGIELYQAGEDLQQEGVQKFIDSFNGLMETIEPKHKQIMQV